MAYGVVVPLARISAITGASAAARVAGAGPVQALWAVADMAISQRKLEATRTARTARLARAEARATDLAPLIAELRASGVTTLQGIADGFNRSSIPTPRGRGEWQAPPVRRLLVRLRFLSDKPAGADVIGQ